MVLIQERINTTSHRPTPSAIIGIFIWFDLSLSLSLSLSSVSSLWLVLSNPFASVVSLGEVLFSPALYLCSEISQHYSVFGVRALSRNLHSKEYNTSSGTLITRIRRARHSHPTNFNWLLFVFLFDSALQYSTLYFRYVNASLLGLLEYRTPELNYSHCLMHETIMSYSLCVPSCRFCI